MKFAPGDAATDRPLEASASSVDMRLGIGRYLVLGVRLEEG